MVTNTAAPVGGLSITEKLSHVSDGAGHIRFAGDYTCTVKDAVVASGSWTVIVAGHTAAVVVANTAEEAPTPAPTPTPTLIGPGNAGGCPTPGVR